MIEINDDFVEQYNKIYHMFTKQYIKPVSNITNNLYDYEDLYQYLWTESIPMIRSKYNEKYSVTTYLYIVLKNISGKLIRSFNSLKRGKDTEIFYYNNKIDNGEDVAEFIELMSCDESSEKFDKIIDYNFIIKMLRKLLIISTEHLSIFLKMTVFDTSQKDIGNAFNISQAQVSRIQKRVLNAISAAFNDDYYIEPTNIEKYLCYDLLSNKLDIEIANLYNIDIVVIKTIRYILNIIC